MVELQDPFGGWINVSSYRYDRDPVAITRGRGDGDNTTPPATANFTLDNTGGLFSPRNPLSPLRGLIKRNTPVRISRGTGTPGLVVNGAGRAECNDSAALSSAGDLDVRIDLQPLAGSSWSTASFDLASKFDFIVNALGWSAMLIVGKIRFSMWPSGTNPPNITSESTVTLAAGSDRRTLRVTVDVDNGAGGNTVTFYTGPSVAGPWTQIGAPIVNAGTTSFFNSTSKVRIGGGSSTSLFTHGHAEATFYAAEVRAGIGGSVVASPNFEARPLDTAPLSSNDFADAQGNTWTLAGTVGAARYWFPTTNVRFFGELSSLPPRWDPSHSDKYIPVVASDVLRRYQQGKKPVGTGLRDFVLSDQTALLSYFPLSSKEGTQYERNIANTNRLTYNFYNEALPDKPVFKYGVDMGAGWIGSGMELERTSGASSMRGDQVSWDSNVAFDFVWQANALGALSVSLHDYSGAIWTLDLNDISDSGLAQVSYTDPGSGPVGFATFAVPEINDTDMHIGRLQITNNGANIDYAVYVDGTVRKTGTWAGANTNGAAVFRIRYSHANTGQGAVNLAHLITWANATAALIPTAAAVAAAALGYAGETAGRRIERVAAGGDLPIAFVGNLDQTTRMGVQFAESRLAQIRDAEATDFGILATSRTANSLWYRTRQSLYNQTAALVLDYSAKVVAPPFEPVDDDAATRNDVTATRRDGGSYEMARTSGPLAAIDPPVGIGQYEDEVTVNVETDAQLPAVAAWRLNWGTLDAARYPSLSINFQALYVVLGAAAAEALITQVLAVDLGDLVQVNNIDAADIPDDLELIALGYTESFTNRTWNWTANCGPYDLYRVAKFGSGRYDAVDCTLNAAINSTATSLVVNTPTVIWTRTATPFDCNIGGERVTVGGVTGTGPTQTFNPVTRGVNGVAIAHAAGESVRLWTTPRFAL
ncbi:MAG: hypothetical protein HOV78_05125 [Hamadaea sp.]|nr:hypothetical protein [Hamadaea sp.]